VVSSNGLDSRIPERAGNALADNSNNAVLSPDGQALLFSDGAAVVGVNYSLCLHKPIQSPVVRLGDGNAQALSPDGKWALSMVATSPRRLTLYPTGAGEPRPLREWQHPKLRHCHFFPTENILDVQFDIHRELADMASGAQEIGAGEACGTHNRLHRFRTDFLILSMMAATTRQLTLIRGWGCELQ
jgi:hypothetical protein